MKSLFIAFLFLFPIHTWALDSVNPTLLKRAQSYRYSKVELTHLVDYLTQGLNSDQDKAEVLFYWIAENIAYDVEGLQSGSYKNNDNDPLITKKGVCSVYSKLYKSMCDYADLECYIINGYSKGLGYEVGVRPTRTNHAWNAVKIGEKFLFIDATWGSGYVTGAGSSMKFVKRMNLRNVLVRDKYFAAKHLPGDPMWQLSSKIISLKQFVSSRGVEKISNDQKFDFDYMKRLKSYRSLNEADRLIVSAVRTYKFNKTHTNLEHVAIYYQMSGYDLIINKKDIEKGIQYYKKSISALQLAKRKTPQMEEMISGAHTNIKYGNYLLRTL